MYELDKSYNLSLSLFERLVNNGVNFQTLTVQRRMRPEISKLPKIIYPDLIDGENVKKYENIRGLKRNLWFVDHEKKEIEN